MKELRIKSPAKVNLFLEILGKRKDGYHNVETILETVNLFDDVILKETKEGIEIESDFPNLPLGRENLAYQAASLLKERLKIKRGVQITINKKIPSASGLGGGSSNAASVLLGLNRLWNLNLSYEELVSLAREIGVDVPFFLRGGRALGKGRGDELQALSPNPTLYFILISPDFGVSTEWAYKNLTSSEPCFFASLRNEPNKLSLSSPLLRNKNLRDLTKERQSIKIILFALKSGNVREIGNSLYNRLEEAVIPRYPQIAEIKGRLLELGACGALMSGSGPSVFGIVRDYQEVKRIHNKIRKDFERVFLLESFYPVGDSPVDNFTS